MDETTSTVVVLGAGWGALQAVCAFLTAVLPKHTIVFRIAKALVSGAARPLP